MIKSSTAVTFYRLRWMQGSRAGFPRTRLLPRSRGNVWSDGVSELLDSLAKMSLETRITTHAVVCLADLLSSLLL